MKNTIIYQDKVTIGDIIYGMFTGIQFMTFEEAERKAAEEKAEREEYEKNPELYMLRRQVSDLESEVNMLRIMAL